MIDTVVHWLQGTALSHLVGAKTWIWPLAETLHFIGLALVIGIIGFLDLRLLGLFRRAPIAAIRELVPFAVLGFVLNAVTGVIFLVGHPEQYAHSRAWWYKVGCLVVAGLNAAAFEWTIGPRTTALPAGAPTPFGAKCVGVVSLAAWLGVLYWGRMLPFIGDAF